MSSLWTQLLFLHGHVADAELARRLAAGPAAEDPTLPRCSRGIEPPKTRTSAKARTQAPACGDACASA